ncbi:MAG TPA: sulfatase [Phycisphaerae bacterium]|nr:sulfatase [Phycisphaerae bacterium]
MTRNVSKVVICAIACLIQAISAADEAGSRPGRPNVLMIAVDDLRPEVGCYGASYIHSPNIDKLARSGMVFTRAYCQQAVCSPSRTSLLTGLRPDTTRIYDLDTHFRKTVPDAVTLPEHFRKNGYHTQGMGKIFHNGLDDPRSWSVPHWMPTDDFPTYAKPETLARQKARREQMKAEGARLEDTVIERDPQTGTTLWLAMRALVYGPPWEDPDVPDDALPDGMTVEKAVQVLREVKDRPFFLAVGFSKPHLPFVAPKKYYDLYPPDSVRLADNPRPPVDVPDPALSDWGELRQYDGMPQKGPVSAQTARELIRGYRAATSYTDAQIGRVLDELDRLGLRERTIVVLWGDHGWHLGEHGLWCKHTNFEDATRSLMVVSTPGQKHPGAKTAVLAEFVDIYPTLCELTGLPIPPGLEGTSFVPALNDPERPWKKAAFSQYPRQKLMGYSIRTDRYRYTEWAEPGKEPVGLELYDHQTDPGENANVASRPEHKELTAQLAKQLHAGWREALPEGRR